jgi:putative hydrolase of the HAD superfamily
MQIKAVILDYGGVLCFHPTDAQVDELADTCGASPERFLEAYWSTRIPYDRGDVEPQRYWSAIGRQLGHTYSASQIEAFRKLDVGFWVQLDARMVNWAQRMRDCGYGTAVLSNLPPDLGEHMRTKMNLLERFDCHTFSFEVRAVKPDRAIYEDCIHKLGITPAEALFVDDRPENVRGARELGINAVLFESPSQLQQELARLSTGPHNAVAFGAPPVVLE